MLLVALVGSSLAPQAAYAYAFNSPPALDPVTGVVCPNPGAATIADEKKGLTRRVMPCIKENIITATNNFLGPFSNYMSSAVAAACTLAVALWGALVASGRHGAITREMAVLAIKVGCVIAFTSNFAGLFPWLLDAMDDLLGRVGLYTMTAGQLLNNPNCMTWPGDTAILLVWSRIDCAIETLIGGVFSDFSLVFGIVGFLFACIFSGPIGIFVAMLGFYLVFQLLLIAVHALYIFISAYIAFAIMIMVSPICIPTILFSYTKGIFDKWLRLTLSFIMQPVILFAYLSMLVAAYNTIVFTAPYSLAHALAGPDADMPGFTLGGWLQMAGALGVRDLAEKEVEIEPKEVMIKFGAPEDLKSGLLGTVGERGKQMETLWKNGIASTLGIGENGVEDLRHFKINLRTNALDLEMLAAITGAADTVTYIVGLLLSLIMACVVAYILKTLLQYLPFISASVLGTSPTLMLGAQQMAPPGGNLMQEFTTKMNQAMSGAGNKFDGLRKGAARGGTGNMRTDSAVGGLAESGGGAVIG